MDVFGRNKIKPYKLIEKLLDSYKKGTTKKSEQIQGKKDYINKKSSAKSVPGTMKGAPINTTQSPYDKPKNTTPPVFDSSDSVVSKEGARIKPAQNRVTPAVSKTNYPSHLKSEQYPLRVTAANKGGLQVKSPSADSKPVVTGNLSTKRIDMHQQARNMINRPTSTEEMMKRRRK